MANFFLLLFKERIIYCSRGAGGFTTLCGLFNPELLDSELACHLALQSVKLEKDRGTNAFFVSRQGVHMLNHKGP